MKFIGNSFSDNCLYDILPGEDDEIESIDQVYAAIAYGNDKNQSDGLIQNCLDNGLRLDIWMRYDHTVPVSVELLEKLYKSQSENIFTKLIPDYLHSKLIWWKGYGAYIGSANLTDRAWKKGIEAGVFFNEGEIIENRLDEEFERFFDELKNVKLSLNLSKEIITEMKKLSLLRSNWEKDAASKRKHKFWKGPVNIDKKKGKDRQKDNFKHEWLETIGFLKNIGQQLNKYTPSWITKEIPEGWHTDQFLHAYYYNRVSEGRLRPFEKFHLKNKGNPKAALIEAMSWWKSQPSPPSGEDETIFESAPYIQNVLSKENIKDFDLESFINVCGYTHATKDHIIKFPLNLLGKGDIKSMSREERIPLVAEWIWQKRNNKGWDVKQVFEYILYGGNDSELWERLYYCGREDDYKIPHYGLNSLAEVSGWVRPEIAPPRNGRTSKGLRALGYNVRIY